MPAAAPFSSCVRKNRKVQQSLLTMRNFFMGTEREPHGGVARAETWAKDDDNDLTLLLEWLHCSRFEDKGDIARCVAAFELGVMYHLGGTQGPSDAQVC